MLLIIDIDEEIYNHMKERFMYGYADTELDKVGLAVSNGKSLSEILYQNSWEQNVNELKGIYK